MESPGQIFIFSILKTFTKELFLTFCSLLITPQLFAQVSDTFSDNELTQNPLWTGNPDHFSVESGVLYLRAPADGSPSWVSTPSALVKSAQWECQVHLLFNPSSSNFCRIYLNADHPDLNSALNGYFVQVGSTSDDVCLFRQTGTDRVKLIDGRDGLLNGDENALTVRVTRKASGEWELLTRYDSSSEFNSEGVADDPEIPGASHTGIQCVYTSTRADKFSFDNFLVTSVEDTEPPLLLEIQTVSKNEIKLVFSEPVDKVALEDLRNYESPLGRPVSARQDESNSAVVFLSFPVGFEPWKDYELTVQNLADIAGNILRQTTMTFSYRPAVSHAYRDIAITELLADPSPTVGLPDGEFIELLNLTSLPVDLSRWRIGDGSTEGTLPEGEIIEPGQYVILTSPTDASAFGTLGRVISVASFPSLNNGGDDVILKDPNGHVIDSIRFESSWHGDTGKRSGGWSLEIIDPRNPCGGKANWSSSDHDSGGTPGAINSINEDKPDLTGPGLLLAMGLLPDTVMLIFDETLGRDPASPSDFSFAPARNVTGVAMNPSQNTIRLVVQPALSTGESLTIMIDNVYDCSGNLTRSAGETIPVIFPEPADSLDVVINEVMFNPRVNSADFVEVFNRSQKYIALGGWAMGNPGEESIGNLQPLQTELLILGPGEYAAFTEDRQAILSDFPSAPESRIFESPTPPMNDHSGAVAIVDAGGRVIDAIHYSDEMHSVFLKDNEGVSLERISAHESSFSAANWKSGASQNGFATPGYLNANTWDPEAGRSGEIVVAPEIFAPLSGEGNFTTISYNFGSGGFIGTISVLDRYGRCVKKIADNALLGASGFFRWDGDRDDGTKASIGNYMIRVDLFNSQGVAKVVRKRVAVAARL